MTSEQRFLAFRQRREAERVKRIRQRRGRAEKQRRIRLRRERREAARASNPPREQKPAWPRRKLSPRERRIAAERRQMARDPDRGARLLVAMLWRWVLDQHSRERAETDAALAFAAREEREAWQWMNDPDWCGPTPLPVSVWPSILASAPEVD